MSECEGVPTHKWPVFKLLYFSFNGPLMHVFMCPINSGVARIGCEGPLKYTKLFVAHKMMRNITLNKVHVAATELQQLLSQNTNVLGEATA